MFYFLPTWDEEKEFALIDWQKLKSYDLLPLKVGIRMKRNWEDDKDEIPWPENCGPKMSGNSRKVTIHRYKKNPEEACFTRTLDPNNPQCIQNVYKFIQKQRPQAHWYMFDIWVKNMRKDSPFYGAVLRMHLSEVENVKGLGKIKALKLVRIDDKKINDCGYEVTSLLDADNGFHGENKCKQMFKVTKASVVSEAACGI